MSRLPATVCVVGGGIIGSWTALHLAEAGVDTTLVDQFPFPHTRGSSHGLSRAFRLLGDETLDRLDYSAERWRALEQATGESLFVKTGLLNFGPPGDPYLEKYMGILREGGRPFEWLDNKVLTSRFPLFRYPSEWGATWDPSGGILIAHRCVDAVQSRFRAIGGRIVTARVESIDSKVEAGVCVTLRADASDSAEDRHFDQAVVCAGSWTSRLIPQLASLLRCLSIPVTYWSDPSGKYSVAEGFPILFNSRLKGVYALPSYEYPGLVKVLFHGGPETDPDTRDLADLSPYVEKVSAYIRDHLPGLDHRKPAILEPCLYTMTSDDEPILDRISNNLIVGCGFSGSGFKHSPATGWTLAALALGREELLPDGFLLGRYRLERFR